MGAFGEETSLLSENMYVNYGFKNGFFYDTNLTVQLDTDLAHGSILNVEKVSKAKSYKFARITF